MLTGFSVSALFVRRGSFPRIVRAIRGAQIVRQQQRFRLAGRDDFSDFYERARSERVTVFASAGDSGSRVNLERSLTAGAPLGLHYVTGHVDGLAHVDALSDDARSRRPLFELPAELARYVGSKGSVTVEGVSLTVNEVQGRRFGVNIIPHTRAVTTLGELELGSTVNV